MPGGGRAESFTVSEPSVSVRLVGEARERVPQGLQGRDALVTAWIAGLFAGTVGVLAATLPSSPQASWLVVLLLVLCHSALCRVE